MAVEFAGSECASAQVIPGHRRCDFDVVIFLTGVGTRALVSLIERTYSRSREAFVGALARTKVVARGPKPLAALRELEVPVWVVVPEPNTWRELLAALDARAEEQPMRGARVAGQEYGVSNTELLEALRRRGARVTRVPVIWHLVNRLAGSRRSDLTGRSRRSQQQSTTLARA